MAVEDCGDTTLFDTVVQGGFSTKTEELFKLAADMILCTQGNLEPDAAKAASDCVASWHKQVKLFSEWTLPWMRVAEPEWLQESLERIALLAAEQQPRLAAQFDVHSRNLMVVDDSLVALDFQDWCVAMPGLDLASLLDDLYVDIPAQQRDVIKRHYIDGFNAMRGTAPQFAGLEPLDGQQLDQWLAIASLQRFTRVSGTFVRLSVRDGRGSHLSYLDRVHQRMIDAAATGSQNYINSRLSSASYSAGRS